MKRLLDYGNRFNFGVLDMKTPVEQLPSRTLLLTEKRFADVPNGIPRDYKLLGQQSSYKIPKLSKLQKKEFDKYGNAEEGNNYNDDSPTKYVTNIAYQVQSKLKC